MASSTTDSSKSKPKLVSLSDAKAKREEGFREALISMIPTNMEEAEKVIMINPAEGKIVFRADSYPNIEQVIGILEMTKTAMMLQLISAHNADD